MVLSWSGVSTWAKASSSSRCHGVSGRERVPGRRHAGGVQADQLGRDLLDVALGPALGLLPVRAAHLAEGGLLPADVAGDLVELVGRHVEAVGGLPALGCRVLEHEVLTGRGRHGALHHLHEPPDAVLLVHDEVTRLQREGVDLVAAPRRHPAHVLGRGPGPARRAGEVGLGDDGQALPRHEEPGADPARGDRDQTGCRVGTLAVSRTRRVRDPADEPARDVVLGEHLGDALGQARPLRRDEHRPVVGDEATQVGHGILGVAPEGGRDLEAEVEHVAVVVTGEGGEVEPAHAQVAGLAAQLGQGAERRRAEDGLQVDGHDVAARGVGPACLEELLARGAEVVGPGAHPLGVAGDEQRAVGQDVEQGLHAVDEGRREGLHALDRDAVGELLEEVDRPGEPVGELGGPGAHRVGEQQLAARWRPQAVLGDLEGALVGDLEPADLLDRVTPELQAQGVLLGGREDVEDAPAHGELAAPLDEVGAGVGSAREVLDDLLERAFVAGLERHRAQVTQALGDRLEDGSHGGHDDGERAVGGVPGIRVGEAPEHGQSLTDGVAARAEPLVREGLPAGEEPDAPLPQAGLEGGLEVLGLAAGRGDGEHGGAGRRGARGEGGDEERAGAGRCSGGDLCAGDGQGLPKAFGAREGGDAGAQGGQRGHREHCSRAGRHSPPAAVAAGQRGAWTCCCASRRPSVTRDSTASAASSRRNGRSLRWVGEKSRST